MSQEDCWAFVESSCQIYSRFPVNILLLEGWTFFRVEGEKLISVVFLSSGVFPLVDPIHACWLCQCLILKVVSCAPWVSFPAGSKITIGFLRSLSWLLFLCEGPGQDAVPPVTVRVLL